MTKLQSHKGEKVRNQFFIFVLCLVISLFLWMLVRLSKDYSYTIDYGITYTQIPENLRMVSFTDTVMTLQMKVQGFDFFTERILKSPYRKTEISLKNIRLKPSGKYLTGYMTTMEIGKEIALQTNITHEVYAALPDTLFFRFERIPLQKVTTVLPQTTDNGIGQPRFDTIIFIHDSAMKARIKSVIEKEARDNPDNKKQ
ncbi:MAG: hypothetical protein NTX61_10705 [Bacteroidetes bacterium]|nr:hypothetical protein [Bacteroidota bacterium]